ncbi:MAG: hypothetical protein AB1640_25530 [bacterium]
MGICGFRADSFDFGLLEGGELRRLADLLQAVEQGATAEDLVREGDGVLASLEQAGFVSLRGKAISLEDKGKALLDAMRSLRRVPS